MNKKMEHKLCIKLIEGKKKFAKASKEWNKLKREIEKKINPCIKKRDEGKDQGLSNKSITLHTEDGMERAKITMPILQNLNFRAIEAQQIIEERVEWIEKRYCPKKYKDGILRILFSMFTASKLKMNDYLYLFLGHRFRDEKLRKAQELLKSSLESRAGSTKIDITRKNSRGEWVKIS